MVDCSIFYKNGKLLPWSELPIWYIQFLCSSPPDKETEIAAKRELKKRRSGLTTNRYKNFLYLLCVFVFLVVVAVGNWFISRELNYSFSYKAMVEQSIREMVKKEALK